MLFSFIVNALLGADAGPVSTLCDIEHEAGKRFYLKACDDFIIESNVDVYYAKPVAGEYSNFGPEPQQRPEIDYIIENIGSGRINVRNLLGVRYAGTHVFITGMGDRKSVSSKFLFMEYTASAIQLAVRADDTYIGYLTELFNTPFIWVPKKISGVHQTDACVGSDCISFVIYGMRRMNRNIPYIHPGRVREFTRSVSGETCHQVKGVYVDSGGRAVKLEKIRPGDLLYFKAHIAVFYRDEGIPGVLDKDDLVIHSIKTGAHISTIEDCNYYELPLEVLRWNDFK